MSLSGESSRSMARTPSCSHGKAPMRGCGRSQSQLEAFAQSDGDAASSAVTPGAVSGMDALEMLGEAGEPVCAAGADRRGAKDAAPARRRSNFSIMARLVGLTRPLLPVMALAIRAGRARLSSRRSSSRCSQRTACSMHGGRVGCAPHGRGVRARWPCAAWSAGRFATASSCATTTWRSRSSRLCATRCSARCARSLPAKLEGRDKGDLVSLLTRATSSCSRCSMRTRSRPLPSRLSCRSSWWRSRQRFRRCWPLYAAFSYAVVGIAVPWISSKASGTGGREVRDAIGSMNALRARQPARSARNPAVRSRGRPRAVSCRMPHGRPRPVWKAA